MYFFELTRNTICIRFYLTELADLICYIKTLKPVLLMTIKNKNVLHTLFRPNDNFFGPIVILFANTSNSL